MSEATPDKCPEWIYGKDAWTPGHRCDRPVKVDGLCGMHAKVKEKREARSSTIDAQRARAKVMAERLGLPESCGYYDDLLKRPVVVMSMIHAEALALRLEDAEGKGNIP